ncbi:ABCB family ABC transporter ATP-binding protein/permease [Plasticicumulans acidivorans]|uniref:ATP-binding cassette subfamily B protein n=1 Tax=Plasticicumulans acidivorans TaxID=886464 RepID=A0A317MZ90_9GAMM|nr:ABC transporter ATP-binding protein/permease [Plasticicumulans acidivorans]PWV64406.1 ATP-binding cassette subfamily B protein [Plasticicumulans acidivorans]
MMPPGQRYTELPSQRHSHLHNLRALAPYLWEYRGRVLAALICLLLAKLAGVGVPLLLKDLVDALGAHGPLTLPVALLAAYGGVKIAATVFNELRDTLFAAVRFRAVRRITIRTVEHLHRLSLRFHLERRTGALTRDLQRGSQSLSTLLNYLVFSVLPAAIELALICGVLLLHYDVVFVLIVLGAIGVYVAFTLAMTNWRIEFRHDMNRLESQAQNEAVDGLINYETVKYFGNERLELARCDATLARWEQASVGSQNTLALLNFGQGMIIALGVTLMMFVAAQQVVDGRMSIGDLVLVNAFLLQLFIPLNFLGVVYRMIRYTLADMDSLVALLEERPEVVDAPDAPALQVGAGEVRFEDVRFAYQPQRPILHGVSFSIAPGHTVAVVGASGAGKSTLARLLFRFYDVQGGRILIDGQDIAGVTQDSLRAAIGIVPQDTVLFNESLAYNLRYARPDASDAEIAEAARLAQLHAFIASLPQGYATLVGERGLKLSGGEKQRVAIARAILKRPRILVFDEATSSLDSRAEQAILHALHSAARGHTTLVIAHRLSTIVDADEILVMEGGHISERGTHAELLARGGQYAELWALQQRERADAAGEALA